MTVSTNKRESGPRTVVLERVFDAPRELLYTLFTDPAHLARWWVPYPLTCPRMEFDARPGGAFRMEMQTSDGVRFPFIGTVIEADPPTRLVFSSREDWHENDAHGTEVLQTITFTARGDQTAVRLEIDVTQSGPATPQALDGMTSGWMQDFGRLTFYLLSWTAAETCAGIDAAGPNEAVVTTPSDREIVVTRIYDAPRALIYKTMMDPDTIPNWWGSRGLTTTVEAMDARPYGAWRFCQHGPDGDVFGFRGEYILIAAPELVVTSYEVEAAVGQTAIDAVHLHEDDGRTILTSISLFPTRADRDRSLHMGSVNGAIESYERLAALLPALT
jgi:uncharacterized protein YndB with AHSA1/START domain